MCVPMGAGTLIPLIAGAGLQVGSYLMNKNAQEGAYDRQAGIQQQMFDLSKQTRGDQFNFVDKEVQQYQPGQYDARVQNEQDAMVARAGEQYDAALSAAPDKTFTGQVTENFDANNQANAAERREDWNDTQSARARIVAPATVNADDRRGTRQTGEQMWLTDAGERGQQGYLGLAHQNVRPNYSVVADLASAFGNAAMMQGISTLGSGGGVGPSPEGGSWGGGGGWSPPAAGSGATVPWGGIPYKMPDTTPWGVGGGRGAWAA